VYGLKFSFYRHFGWIASFLLAATAVFSSIWLYVCPDRWNLVVTLAGGVLSICTSPKSRRLKTFVYSKSSFKTSTVGMMHSTMI
jgi:hypothetical protein